MIYAVSLAIGRLIVEKRTGIAKILFSSTPAIVDTLLKKYAGAGEETSAMMIEDWVSFNIDPTFNAVRDIRFNQYLAYEGHGSCT